METDILKWMHSQLSEHTCVAVSAEDKDGDRWKSIGVIQPFKTLVNRDARQIYWRKDYWDKNFSGELFTYDDNYIYLHTETFPRWFMDPITHWDHRYSRFRIFVNKSIADSDFRIGRVIAPRTITEDWELRQRFDTYLCDSFDELAKSKCLPWQKDFFDTSVKIKVCDAFNTLYDGNSPTQPTDDTFRAITVFDKAIVINQVMEGNYRERFIFAAKNGTYYGIVRWDWAELSNGKFVVKKRTVGLGIQQNVSFSFDGMHQRALEDVYLPPPKPTGLKASWECGYKIVFSWNQAPGASRYDIRIDDTSDGWNPHHLSRYDAIVDGIVGTSFTFPAIPGHEYSWWLHATNDAGSSEPTGGGKVRCEVTETPQLVVSVQPAHTPLGQSMQITVLVQDAISRNPVTNAKVLINNFAAGGKRIVETHDANQPFPITLRQLKQFDPETKKWYTESPSATVDCPGYPSVEVPLRF